MAEDKYTDMKQVLMQRGTVGVFDVPAPLIEKGHLLVEVAYSLISTGTEVSTVASSSGASLAKQVLEQPERMRKLIDHLKKQGIQKTLEKVKGKLDTLTPLGYSCAGRVIGVGPGVDGFQPGDPVACAGAGLANHAEVILAPYNLVVKVPEGCDLRSAASVTLGAIAMQGVRRADPRLGEVVAVIGLGLLGLISVELLSAAGCQVLGFDLDPRRVELARTLGAAGAFVSAEVDPVAEVLRRTGNHGADATIITAASTSDELVQQAMQMTRKKGKVVVVGAVGLGLKRSPFYEKEIDFLISCSYGPGRYDPAYERQGLDYPYAFVRWTENRNMEAYLRLIAAGQIKVNAILEREVDVENASQAFAALMSGEDRPLGVLLRYTLSDGPVDPAKLITRSGPRLSAGLAGKIGVALVGAGNFARDMHLPNLQKLGALFQLQAVVDASGVTAKATCQQFNIPLASTCFADILSEPAVNLVMVCTRHHLHGQMVIAALRAGKHVFVEKPLTLSEAELAEMEAFFAAPGAHPLLMTGFNRRFSPFARRMGELVQDRQAPMILNYRMNAGYLPLDHWVHSPEGGGRNRGEACHIYDLFTYLTGSPVSSVTAQAIRPSGEYYSAADNFSATLGFADGSVATLTYTALGSADYPKELAEIYVDGKVLALNDYRSLSVSGARVPGVQTKTADKGHLEELRFLAEAIRGGGEWPIPLWQQAQATRIANQVESLIHPE